MSEPSNSAWPFSEITNTEGLDIDKIFGTGSALAYFALKYNPILPARRLPV